MNDLYEVGLQLLIRANLLMMEVKWETFVGIYAVVQH